MYWPRLPSKTCTTPALEASSSSALLQCNRTWWRWFHFSVASWQAPFPQCSLGKSWASICGPETPSLCYCGRFSSTDPSAERNPTRYVVLVGITQTVLQQIGTRNHEIRRRERRNQLPAGSFAPPHCGPAWCRSWSLTWIDWLAGWLSCRRKAP